MSGIAVAGAVAGKLDGPTDGRIATANNDTNTSWRARALCQRGPARRSVTLQEPQELGQEAAAGGSGRASGFVTEQRDDVIQVIGALSCGVAVG
jgi:hypothetical protein